MSEKILQGPQGIKLILDPKEYFPDDPGQGTPAMVEYKGGYATYECAVNEGYVDHSQGDIKIPQSLLNWLSSKKIENEIELMYKEGNKHVQN